jgi:sugar lactone lactonase YvrE
MTKNNNATFFGEGGWCAHFGAQFVACVIRAGLVAFSLGFVFNAQAFSPAVTQNGLTWLSSQVQPTGDMASGAASGAADWQVQAETISTLRTFNQPLPPALLTSLLNRPDEGVVELLARQVVASTAGGLDSSGLQAKLLAAQQAGTGWGATTAHQPNVLDTAYALWALNTASNTSGVGVGLQYLRSQQYASGGFGPPSTSTDTEQPSVFGTALAVQAIAAWRQQFEAGTTLANAQNWLLGERTAGAYASVLDNALALLALSRQTSDDAVLLPLVNALANAQQANGSWGDDGYLTALALRALGTYNLAPPAATTGGLTGTVVDQNTGAPLANVTVALVGSANQTVATDAQGGFTVYNIVPGAYKLSLSQTGYATVQVNVDVAVGQLLNLGVIRLVAAPNTANLSGFVRDNSGNPLVNALVAVGANSALTDNTGAYAITGIEAGTHDAQVSLSGYATVTASIAFAPGQSYVFSPTLPSAGYSTTLTGTVVDADTNAPIGGATVQLGSATATTAANGTFSLANLNPGSFTVSVSAAGYPSAQVSGVLLTGANSLGSIRLPKQPAATTTAHLSGVVKNTGGTPLLGVTVSVGALTTQTDAQGAYQLSGIAAGYASVKATLAGYSDITVLVNFEAGKQYVFSPVMGSTPTYATLQGKVVDAATSAPIAGATLTLGSLTRSSGADGSFAFQNLSPGDFNLQVSAAGHQGVSVSGTLTLGTNDAGRIPLAPQAATRKLSGVVTDALTQAPIAGASLSLAGVTGAAVTAADGRYSFDAVGGNSASLTATATGYVSQTFALSFGQAGDAIFDVRLSRPIASHIAIRNVQTNKPSYEPFGPIELEVEVQNGDAQAASLLIEADVVDAQNRVVYTFMGNAPTGGAGVRQPNQPLLVPANGTLTVPMEWHALRQPAGTYRVRARAMDGSGQVVAEGQTQFDVAALAIFSGGLTTNPPLVQYGTQQAVALSASVTNVGNLPIAAGNVDVKVILENPDTTGTNQTITRAIALASGTPLSDPRGLDRDAAGNLYTVNRNDGKVLMYDASGQVSVLATLPNGTYPQALTLTPNGHVWVLCTNGFGLYQVTPTGQVNSITVDALSSLSSIGVDGSGALVIGGTQRQTGQPQIIRRDAAGTETVLYTGGLANPVSFVKDDSGHYVVTNYGDSTLAKVSAADGSISAFVAASSGPAALNRPWGITRDVAGNFYVANSGANNVIKVSPQGVSSVYASGFNGPRDVKFDATGTLYVSSQYDNTIYTVAPGGTVAVYARGGVANSPQGMRYDAAGNLWIANNDGTLRVLDSSGQSQVVATGLSNPRGLALDTAGNAYVADYSSGSVQKISSTGQRSTFASGLSGPWGVAVDASGHVWVSEYDNVGRIKTFDATGSLLTTTQSLLTSPSQVLLGTHGEVYVRNSGYITVVDGAGARVLYQNPSVVMENIAVDPSSGQLLGKRGNDLYRIDSATGTATQWATLPSGTYWYGIAADASGNAYSIDYYARVVNRISPAGVVTPFSGVLSNYASALGNDLAGKLTAYYTSNTYYRFAADGTATEWQLPYVEGNYIYRLETGADGSLLALSYSKSYVVNPDTQALLQTINIPYLYSHSSATLGSDGVLHSVNSSGQQLYQASTGATSLTAVLSGFSYLQDMDWLGGDLLVVGASNRWYRYTPGAAQPTLLPNAPDHSGYLAVADGVAYAAYGGSGLFQYANGTASRLGSFNGYADGGVAARTGAVAVASANQSRVTVFDSVGAVSAQYAGIVSPQGLAFDAAGKLLVASYGNHSVVRFAGPNQSALLGAVSYPQFLAWDGQGKLWVTSSYTVVRLDAQGSVAETRALPFSAQGVDFDGARMVLPNYGANQLGEWQTDHWQVFAAGLSSAPVALDVDATNTVWLASGNNGSLLTLQNNALQTQTTGLTNLSALRVSPDGVYLGGNGWGKLRKADGTLIDLKLDVFTNGNPIQGMANGGLHVLVGGNPAQLLTLKTTQPAAVAPVGTVAYQTTLPMPALPSADGYLTLDLGQWMPPYGGDFKVQVTRSGVQGSLDNYVHVGPHATSDLQALKTELPPGDPTLPMCMNLDGADFTSISRVEIANVKPLVSTGTPLGLTSDRSGNIYYTSADTLYKAVPGQATGVALASGFSSIAFGLATDSAETMYLSSFSTATGRYELKAIAKDGSQRTVVELGTTRPAGLVVNSKDEVLVGTVGQLLKVTPQGQLTVIPSAGLPAPRGIAIDGKDNVYVQNDSGGQPVTKVDPSGTTTVIFHGADGVENPVFEGDGYPNIAADCAENFYIAPFNWQKIGQVNTEEHVLAQVIPRTGRVAVLFDTLKVHPTFNDIDYLAYDRLNNRLLVWNDSDKNVWGVPVTCGAISVDVHLFAKPGQRFTGATKAPVATIAQADGRTEYVWSLKDVTSSGAQVCFDASQNGLTLGENRTALDSGYMSFQNSFVSQPVKVPMGVPRVRGANLVGMTVATDKAEYAARSTAQVNATLNNANTRDVSGTLTVDVFDAVGQNVGRVVQQSVSISAQGGLTVPAPFAIGTIVPALYTLKATLVEGNVTVAQAQSDFNVLADQASASAVSQVRTDRKTYQASDRVQLSSMANSRSANVILNNLTLMVRVRGPGGELVYSHGFPVPQLLPGALMNFAAVQPLVNAASGTYTVTQELLDAQNRVLHSTQTTYNVGSSANDGMGLGGSLAVRPGTARAGENQRGNAYVTQAMTTVRIGDMANLTAQVVNQGNTNLTDLPLAIWVVDPATQTVLHQYNTTVQLNVGASVTLVDTWRATGTDQQNLLAVLVATLNASSGSPVQMTLAQSPFMLTASAPSGGSDPQAVPMWGDPIQQTVALALLCVLMLLVAHAQRRRHTPQ